MKKGRHTKSAEEEGLLRASRNGDVKVVISLLQMGVCPNVYEVCGRERENEKNEKRKGKLKENERLY